MLNRIERGVTVESVAPEFAGVDQEAKRCLCGERPLMTEANGLYYMSCSPCWVRTHKVESEAVARAQWNALIRVAKQPRH